MRLQERSSTLQIVQGPTYPSPLVFSHATLNLHATFTGMPPSVFFATVFSLIAYLSDMKLSFGVGDSILSYLPLAHIFDRTAEESFFMFGGKVGYWQVRCFYAVRMKKLC